MKKAVKPMITNWDIWESVTSKVEMPDGLDYSLKDHAEIPVKSYHCDVWNSLDYGSNEGIYLDIGLRFPQEKQVIRLGTFKTLEDNREAMRKMGCLLADLVCEINAYINSHIEDLERSGYTVWGMKEDGSKLYYSHLTADLNKAETAAKEELKNNKFAIIRENESLEEKVYCLGTNGELKLMKDPVSETKTF